MKYHLHPLYANSLSLPPCGGSGLKYMIADVVSILVMSPSMRREWIEIKF